MEIPTLALGEYRFSRLGAAASADMASRGKIYTFRIVVRIPDDADQRSGLMPITHSGRCRSVIPGDADHSFRVDPDQLIAIVGRVIAMPGTVIAIPWNVFHRAK